MTIQEIYTNYKIMPILQTHMLRVASVSKIICESLQIDSKNIITACLLHDIGNIVKFNFDYDQLVLEPEGRVYWENVKKEFVDKYGSEQYQVTHKIIDELGLEARVKELVESVGFTKAKDILESNDMEKWICCYSDQKVGFSSVMSIEERIDEGFKRYLTNNKIKPAEIEKHRAENKFYREFLMQMEKRIFENSKIKPEDITNENVDLETESLKLLFLS
jgi:putative nucleotidyltransferase with HDIG domain